MEKELIKYFKDGITIDKLPTGKYSIFTVKTQRFAIDSLEELTPESFEQAITALEEREKIQSEMFTLFQKELEQYTIEGIPVEELTFEYFKSISELPKTSEIVFNHGEHIQVGPKYQLRLNDGRIHNAYVHSVDVVSNLPENNLVIFIFEKEKKMESLSVKTIKKIVKEFVLIAE